MGWADVGATKLSASAARSRRKLVFISQVKQWFFLAMRRRNRRCGRSAGSGLRRAVWPGCRSGRALGVEAFQLPGAAEETRLPERRSPPETPSTWRTTIYHRVRLPAIKLPAVLPARAQTRVHRSFDATNRCRLAAAPRPLPST